MINFLKISVIISPMFGNSGIFIASRSKLKMSFLNQLKASLTIPVNKSKRE